MTPAQFNLLRATALLSQVPASGVLRDGVREALAVVDAETARGLNAPRDDMATMRHIRQEHRPLLDALAAQPVDTIVAEVRADLLARSERGIAEYGCTLDRTDLTHAQWLQHGYEEALDLACYLKRALRDLPAAAPAEPPHAAGPDVAAIRAAARHEALRDVRRVAHMASNGEPDYAGAVRSLLRGATEALQAAAPVLAPLAPEPPAAVLGRAGEALAWDGRQPPVHVPFEPGAPHPYGDDAYQMTTDGVARMFPSREAAHRWLAAMGKAA